MASDTATLKYELTCETRMVACGGGLSRILNRIRALRDIPRYGVKAGDLGGFIESKKNLSHKGDCWVGDEACVYEEARISGNAFASGRSRIHGKARISGHAIIRGETSVFENASVSGTIFIPVSTSIAGNAEIADDRHVMFIGPLDSNGPFNQHCCLTAYRTKGGGFYASRSYINAFLADSENFMNGSKAFKTLDDFDAACNNGNYRFLTEMARNDPENWSDNEYRFMIEMLRYRAGHWKQTVEPDTGPKKETSTFQDHAVNVPKYELTDETRIIDGRILYRIRALQNIGKWDIKAGDLGGFVESEANLSHEGSCWVDTEACVYEEACVSEDAYICDDGHASGRARITGGAYVFGAVRVSGEACITECAFISGNVHVCGNAVMAGSAKFLDGHCISDDAEITEPDHVIFMGPIGPKNQYLTAYRTKGGGYCIRRSYPGLTSCSSTKIMDENHCGLPHDGDEHRFLLEMAGNTSGDWKKNEYSFMLEMIRCRIMEWKLHG